MFHIELIMKRFIFIPYDIYIIIAIVYILTFLLCSFVPIKEALNHNYIDILNQAKEYVYIMTPYLILDGEMLHAITFAAKRGIDVRIILPHIPDKKSVFAMAKWLQKKTGWVLLNPILLTIATLIVFLKITGISYETFHEGGELIEFWLKPAVVALGVPLYMQLEMIKKQLLPILLSQLVGCLVGLVSVILVAKGLGASPEVICSLAPKSVTTPIAMEVSSATGGIPSLTAAVVVMVGLFGAVFGFKVLQLGQVKSPIAQGLSMGTASHAIGTSAAMEVSKKYGAYASLGLTLNGILTAILAPMVLRLLGIA